MSFDCPHCDKTYKRKGDLTRHLNAKHKDVADDSGEISENGNKQAAATTTGTSSATTGLSSLFDILRADGITGMTAVNHINYLLTLKLLEPRLEAGEFVDDLTLPEGEDWLTSRIDTQVYLWKNILIADNDDIRSRLEDACYILGLNDVLEKHVPVPDWWKFKSNVTIRRVMTGIDAIDMTGDAFGDVYEDMLGRQMMGKDLGQFFTPQWVRKYIVDTIAPHLVVEVNDEGGEVSYFPLICDPAAGTAGFLASAVSYFKHNGTDVTGIEDSLYGVEIEADTYQSGLKHLLIATGQDVPNFVLGDSLRQPTENRYDYVFSNPPFGLKGVKWEDTKCPIKTNNGTALFLQEIIKMLKVGGRAGIVFPNGQELFSNSDDLVDVRRLLMSCCDLTSVVKISKDTFTNAKVATCILFFDKKYEVDEVLSTEEEKRKQIRHFDHDKVATPQVDFFEITSVPTDPNGVVEVVELTSVPIDGVREKGWSLRAEDYLETQEVGSRKEGQDKWPVYRLGDICTFKNGTNITKAQLVDGEYSVVGGGQSPMGTHNSYNVPARTITLSKDGAYAGFVSRYEQPIFVTNHGIFVDTVQHDIILDDYLYLILKYRLQDELYGLQRGMAQPGIKKEQVAELTIPVPPVEEQERIVKEAEELQARIDRRTLDLAAYQTDYKRLDKYMVGDEYRLGDIATFGRGKALRKDDLVDGDVPVIGGGQQPMGYHNISNVPKETILISRVGSAGYVSRYNTPVFATDNNFFINIIQNVISPEYLYLVLKHRLQENLYSLKRGTSQPSIKTEQVAELTIPVPPLEEQERIVDKADTISQRIRTAEAEIKELKEELTTII